MTYFIFVFSVCMNFKGTAVMCDFLENVLHDERTIYRIIFYIIKGLYVIYLGY